MSAEDRPRPNSALAAALALLPALVLAWPWPSLLAADFAPRATGMGLVALLALPAVICAALAGTRASPRGTLLLLVPLLATAAWLGLGDIADEFEAARAVLAWLVLLAFLLLGAAADERWLARGAASVGLLLAAFALAPPYAGALGNHAATSEAATLGAAAGAFLLVRDRGAWRALGTFALLAVLAHALIAPVIACALSLAAACAVAGFALRGHARLATLGLAGLALAVALVPLAPTLLSDDADGAAPAPASAEAPAAGVSVRGEILASSLRMLGAHPFAGVGPGQFAAAFPPWRDPDEIERSSHGHRVESEVEHPHDDWIAPALELGVPAGLAWIAFLALALFAAWRALGSESPWRAALGAGVIALLVHALARAPFTANAAALPVFAAACGALLARGEPEPGRRGGARLLAWGLLALLVAAAPRAFGLVRHGLILQDPVLQDLAREIDDPARRERTLRAALAAAPDSPLALTLDARAAEAANAPPAEVRTRWLAVLERRPARIEALVQLGIAEAKQGERASARARAERALELDPRHPAALQNLAVLELQAGELARAEALLARVPPAHAPDPVWCEGVAAKLALAGLEPESEALFARAGLARMSSEQRYALAKEARSAGRAEIGDAWEARAQRAWADEHAAAGRYGDAVRSLRQDLRLCRERPGPPPPRVTLALAGALAADGRVEEARALLAGISPSARDRETLPAWAASALAAAGLLP